MTLFFYKVETSLLMERFAYGSLNDYLKKANRSDNIYYFVGFAIQIVNVSSKFLEDSN